MHFTIYIKLVHTLHSKALTLVFFRLKILVTGEKRARQRQDRDAPHPLHNSGGASLLRRSCRRAPLGARESPDASQGWLPEPGAPPRRAESSDGRLQEPSCSGPRWFHR